ncbi:MAG: substrate-binding domain-containing protein, partial [Anaerolineales bacterium]
FAVIVHPDNPIARLSLAQVRALLAGQITEWAQVGGAAGAIRVVVREAGSEAALAFNRAVGIELAPTRNALLAPTWAAMRELVAETPGALGYVPAPHWGVGEPRRWASPHIGGSPGPGEARAAPDLNEDVKVVTLDVELQALLVAVALSEPTGPAREFLAWVQSDEGQRVVSQHYIPVRQLGE